MNWGFYFGPAVLINFTNVETTPVEFNRAKIAGLG